MMPIQYFANYSGFRQRRGCPICKKSNAWRKMPDRRRSQGEGSLGGGPVNGFKPDAR
jgi:hypothetical protein